MKNYIFRALVSPTEFSEDDEVDYVLISAENIQQARKAFQRKTAERYHAVREWCLLGVYRQI